MLSDLGCFKQEIQTDIRAEINAVWFCREKNVRNKLCVVFDSTAFV